MNVFAQVEVPFIRQFYNNRIAIASKSIFSFQKLISISNKFSRKSENVQSLSFGLSLYRRWFVCGANKVHRLSNRITSTSFKNSQNNHNRKLIHNIKYLHDAILTLVYVRKYSVCYFFSDPTFVFGSCAVIFGKNGKLFFQ